jgi:hypothetical protein
MHCPSHRKGQYSTAVAGKKSWAQLAEPQTVQNTRTIEFVPASERAADNGHDDTQLHRVAGRRDLHARGWRVSLSEQKTSE